jgi:hypothetical protein
MSDAALESFATIVKLVSLAEAFRGKSPSAEGGTSTRPEATKAQNEGEWHGIYSTSRTKGGDLHRKSNAAVNASSDGLDDIGQRAAAESPRFSTASFKGSR